MQQILSKTVNSKQKQCIEKIDGKVMVLAGPGTGKTTVLIERIKNMLLHGIKPEKILCLTFSIAAAKEMKKRIVRDCGNDAVAISVCTFHGFCSELIKDYPLQFNLPANVKVIPETMEKIFIKDVIDEVKPQYYKDRWGNALTFINTLHNEINELKKRRCVKEVYFSDIKEHYISELVELQKQHEEKLQQGKPDKTRKGEIEKLTNKINKAKELWKIYEVYSSKLLQKGFIDFNDMINFVLDAFSEDSEFVKEISQRYSHFLVDEYQDTSASQNQIVFDLVENNDNDNLFVVGDDDQIIYGFQGAKLDNLQEFLQKYPETELICLTDNYRSTRNILDLSYKLISQDLTRLEVNPDFKNKNINKKLVARNEKIIAKSKPVRFKTFDDSIQEYNFIVEEIEKIINSENCPTDKDGEKLYSEIAVLSPQNADLAGFAELLSAKKIPYQLAKGQSIFSVMSSLVTYFYMQILVNSKLYSDKQFFLLLSEPFCFDEIDYLYLLKQTRKNNKDFISNIYENIGYKWNNPEKINKFIKTYDELKEIKFNKNLKSVLLEIINKTGILDYFMNSPINKAENIVALSTLISEAEFQMQINGAITLKDFVDYLETAFEGKIPIEINKDDKPKNAVQLLTLHGSKGREFEHVYMPNLSKNRCQKNLNSDYQLIKRDFRDKETRRQIQKAEELKILFVGVTRAKYALTMSFSLTENKSPKLLPDYINKDITDDLETEICMLSEDERIKELAKSMKVQSVDYNKEFQDELRQRIQHIKYSASAIGDYNNCPRAYLYRNILKINLEDKDWDSANYGSAIHNTLDNAIKKAQSTGKMPLLEELKDNFKEYLSEQYFSEKDVRDNMIERGEKALENYYPYFKESNFNNIITEYALPDLTIESIPVSGKIDRVERNNDGTYSLYDYKTGAEKTKSQIKEGGDYERYFYQLQFYKLAFEEANPDKKVTRAGLIFVEVDQSKNFYMTFDDEDKNKTKQKLKKVYESINNLEFDPPKKTEATCRFCGYKSACNLNVL